MRALYLWEVNSVTGRLQEEQAHKYIAENDGGLTDGLVEGGVAIGNERSPW